MWSGSAAAAGWVAAFDLSNTILVFIRTIDILVFICSNAILVFISTR